MPSIYLSVVRIFEIFKRYFFVILLLYKIQLRRHEASFYSIVKVDKVVRPGDVPRGGRMRIDPYLPVSLAHRFTYEIISTIN